jgi:hypothetical protein
MIQTAAVTRTAACLLAYASFFQLQEHACFLGILAALRLTLETHQTTSNSIGGIVLVTDQIPSTIYTYYVAREPGRASSLIPRARPSTHVDRIVAFCGEGKERARPTSVASCWMNGLSCAGEGHTHMVNLVPHPCMAHFVWRRGDARRRLPFRQRATAPPRRGSRVTN